MCAISEEGSIGRCVPSFALFQRTYQSGGVSCHVRCVQRTYPWGGVSRHVRCFGESIKLGGVSCPAGWGVINDRLCYERHVSAVICHENSRMLGSTLDARCQARAI